MANRLLLSFSTSLLMIILSTSVFGQKLGFDKLLESKPDVSTTFCVPNNEQNVLALKRENHSIKYGNEAWLFITASPRWIETMITSGELTDFYFEFAPPALMSDTARSHHFVNEVHLGSGGLISPFTGEGVIVGYVDTGLDFNHFDFKNADSSTRILRYWDQSLATGPAPLPYGYGTEWTNTDIDGGLCTSVDTQAHGTTVSGIGSGNGSANGTNKGMSPDATIVVVESDFNAPNWTLTVADACDYIFSVADAMDMPAVVNLSIGTYLGSHDGNDPASEAMETMLDAKSGRIIVAAAGNSGIKGAYHQHTDVTSDTSFVWFSSNPGGAFGANTIFFDLWSDVADATFDFGFAADLPSPSFELRGATNFYGASSSIGVPIYDTLWSGANQLATIEVYTNLIDGAYNMQVLFSQVDSTTYNYRFRTTGTGSYDLWSGAWLGLNDMMTTIPTIGQMPEIAYYVLPDTLQTIVSAWNCSEKIISVGNIRDRLGHIDGNFTQYYPVDLTPPGMLAPKSSKGPSRHNLVKPDIVAAGEISLGSAPMWMVVNPAWYANLDSGRLHLRNGGTSMSSPVVAGIAALYLEKCNNATYLDFKTDMIASAYTDGFTGAVPNTSYGNGKIHALDLLLSTDYVVTVTGPGILCEDPIDLAITSSFTIDSVMWSNGSITLPTSTDSIGSYSAITYDDRGCMAYSDTLTVTQGAIPTILSPIVHIGDTLSTTSSDDYQWTLNGSDLFGETNSSLTVVPPFGTYTCFATSIDGCIAETDSIVVTSGLDIEDLLNSEQIRIYPNPVSDVINIVTEFEIIAVHLLTMEGKIVELESKNGNSYDLSLISKGAYTIVIQTKKGTYQSKITRI